MKKYFSGLVLFCAVSVLAYTGYRTLNEEFLMDDKELSCYSRCDARNKPAMLAGNPEQCYCLTEIEYLKKVLPKVYKKRRVKK